MDQGPYFALPIAFKAQDAKRTVGLLNHSPVNASLHQHTMAKLPVMDAMQVQLPRVVRGCLDEDGPHWGEYEASAAAAGNRKRARSKGPPEGYYRLRADTHWRRMEATRQEALVRFGFGVYTTSMPKACRRTNATKS